MTRNMRIAALGALGAGSWVATLPSNSFRQTLRACADPVRPWVPIICLGKGA